MAHYLRFYKNKSYSLRPWPQAQIPLKSLIKISLIFLLATFSVWCGKQLYNPAEFPIHTIKIWASYRHITQEQLKASIQPEASKGFFGAHLNWMAHTLKEQLPWIDTITLSRLWPDALEITITEKTAVARWQNPWLFSSQGLLFKDNSPTTASQLPLASLPQLEGAIEQMPDLFKQFQLLSGLLNDQPIAIKKLSINRFDMLTLETSQGIILRLGPSDAALTQFQRFLKAYPTLLHEHRTTELKQIDLRYPNGFAVLLKAN